jgi:hypothetical protein
MKCLAIAVVARHDQIILNQISVGKVFTVDDQISARLVIRAMIYSHQI